MAPLSAIIAFSIAAGLLTIAPGLDTALVLRTATVEGAGRAMQAGAGVVAGVLCWGLLASVGLGAVLTASQFGYRLLQYGGAAYIVWLGARLVLDAIRGAKKVAGTPGDQLPGGRRRKAADWFWRGLMTNLLNPKIGVFYVGFLPQFIPRDVPIVAFGRCARGPARPHGPHLVRRHSNGHATARPPRSQPAFCAWRRWPDRFAPDRLRAPVGFREPGLKPQGRSARETHSLPCRTRHRDA